MAMLNNQRVFCPVGPVGPVMSCFSETRAPLKIPKHLMLDHHFPPRLRQIGVAIWMHPGRSALPFALPWHLPRHCQSGTVCGWSPARVMHAITMRGNCHHLHHHHHPHHPHIHPMFCFPSIIPAMSPSPLHDAFPAFRSRCSCLSPWKHLGWTARPPSQPFLKTTMEVNSPNWIVIQIGAFLKSQSVGDMRWPWMTATLPKIVELSPIFCSMYLHVGFKKKGRSAQVGPYQPGVCDLIPTIRCLFIRGCW